MLTEQQKNFAVKEAMNKMGTTHYKKIRQDYYDLLDGENITDEQTIYPSLGNSVNPVGTKTFSMYLYELFNSISNTQVHGVGHFDIRYQILNNPNWNVDEKRKLVYDFYADDKDWEEHLDMFEWDIINDDNNIIDNQCIIEKEFLYNYSFNELLLFFEDEKKLLNLWNKIKFCELMRQLRPFKYEDNFYKQKKLI